MIFRHCVITSAEGIEESIFSILPCVLICQQICTRLQYLPAGEWSTQKWVTHGSADFFFHNMCHCEKLNISLRKYFLEIDYLVTLIVKAMCYLSLLFIKLRDRMLIKKKNVSSKLKEVIQTNCLHARFPQLLCSKWEDSVAIFSEQHSGGQISLQGPVALQLFQ